LGIVKIDAIDAAEAQRILESPDLLTTGARADEIRRQMHGTRTTFVRVFEMHVDAVPASLPDRVSAGEFRIVGRAGSLDAAVAAVRAAAGLAAGVPVTGFSLLELQALGGRSFAHSCRALRDAGLDAVAEVAVDFLQPESAAAIAEARGCGLALTRLIVQSLAASDRIEIVLRARDLQEAVGGFRVFAPLPRTASIAAPSTGYDDVKQVAIARLLATGIESIQVDWPLYGPKLAQFALTIGADDVDGVAAVDPGTLGTRRSPVEEMRGNIASAALEPVERNARYEVIG
jgi:aminodeoxyfutalosine synthase